MQEIFDIIRDIHKEGMTILLVEQNAQMALSVADRAYVLETGHVVMDGTGAELLTQSASATLIWAAETAAGYERKTIRPPGGDAGAPHPAGVVLSVRELFRRFHAFHHADLADMAAHEQADFWQS